MSYQASRPIEPENRFEDVLSAFANAREARTEAIRPAPRAFHRDTPREVRYIQKPQQAPVQTSGPSALDEAFAHYFRQP